MAKGVMLGAMLVWGGDRDGIASRLCRPVCLLLTFIHAGT
jgi:hypothetical protein